MDSADCKTDLFPENYVPTDELIELSPENELKFVEADMSNPQIHSGSSALAQALFTMKNVSKTAVLFKVQTTSPLHYRVKPSHGRIETGETKEVNITMSSDSKKSDKFLINVVPTFQLEENSGLDFNSQFNLVPETFIKKYRLKCVTGSGGNSGLLTATNNGGSGSVGSISSPVAPSLLVGHDSMTSVTSGIYEEKEKSVISSVGSSSAGINSPSVTLQKELKDARAEIDRLKGLTKMDLVAKEWKNVLSAQYGVPPVLVLLVAIFAFMVGLLF